MNSEGHTVRTPTPPGSRRPTIAITMGDPGGIGPETILKALADDFLRAKACFRLVGLERVFRAAADAAGLPHFWTTTTHPNHAPCVDPHVLVLDETPWLPDLPEAFERKPSAAGGRASLAFLDRAIPLAKLEKVDPGRVDAIVTAPISKAAWSLAGETRYPGHTELFAERFGSTRFAMMFESPRLRVLLATIHVPVADVPRLLTIPKVTEAIELAHEACQRLGLTQPRVAVCGLNPHAGEGGLLGREDMEVIRPAIQACRSRGIDASGPFPGDTVFNAAVRGEFDIVVAMYHDQGLIPLKLLAWDQAVNCTVGLSVVRTSPDHGTAFDIAGKNLADPGSMKAAIELAIRLSSAASKPRP